MEHQESGQVHYFFAKRRYGTLLDGEFVLGNFAEPDIGTRVRGALSLTDTEVVLAAEFQNSLNAPKFERFDENGKYEIRP